MFLPSLNKELGLRFITSIIGIAALYLIFLSEYMNEFLSTVLLFLVYSETLIACYKSTAQFYKKAIIFVLAFFYMFFGIGFLGEIAASGLFFPFISSIFATDIAAFSFGKIFKGPKLAPKISPKKTWSGFISGMLIGASAFYFLVLSNFEGIELSAALFISLIFSNIVQFGDLLVSRAKRTLGIKDASNLLPGHGGFWDRCDSLFAGAIFLGVLMIFYGLNLGLFTNA
jgi:CDP-diglyceride synthetase